MRAEKKAALIALIITLTITPSFAVPGKIHLRTPQIVKGIYIEFGNVGTPHFWDLANMIERTELNTMVIDIRSNGGPILYNFTDSGAQALLARLHKKNIYLVARIVCFNAGGSWYDPASRTRWSQIAEASRRAISLGFDEINYNYVRYGAAYEPQSSTPPLTAQCRYPFFLSIFETGSPRSNRPADLG